MESKRYVSSVPGGNSFLGDTGPTEGTLFSTVLPYVLLIVILPIAVFFSSKSLFFEDILGFSDTSAHVYSAISAVIVLHVLLGLFIYKAFKDSQPKGKKQD